MGWTHDRRAPLVSRRRGSRRFLLRPTRLRASFRYHAWRLVAVQEEGRRRRQVRGGCQLPHVEWRAASRHPRPPTIAEDRRKGGSVVSVWVYRHASVDVQGVVGDERGWVRVRDGMVWCAQGCLGVGESRQRVDESARLARSLARSCRSEDVRRPTS